MRDHWKMLKIENDREITQERDSAFLFTYQNAVLLSLKDSGILTEMAYRSAVEALRAQQHTWTGSDALSEP